MAEDLTYAGVNCYVIKEGNGFHTEWAYKRRITRLQPVNGTHDVKVAGGHGDWQRTVTAGKLSAADAATLYSAADGVTARSLTLSGTTYPLVYCEAEAPKKADTEDYWELELTFSRET